MVCNDSKPFMGGHQCFFEVFLAKDNADPLNNLVFPISGHNYSRTETERQNSVMRRLDNNLYTSDYFLYLLSLLSPS